MTTAVQALLADFDALSDRERREAVTEILRRVPATDGEMPEEALVEAADALLRTHTTSVRGSRLEVTTGVPS